MAISSSRIDMSNLDTNRIVQDLRAAVHANIGFAAGGISGLIAGIKSILSMLDALKNLNIVGMLKDLLNSVLAWLGLDDLFNLFSNIGVSLSSFKDFFWNLGEALGIPKLGRQVTSRGDKEQLGMLGMLLDVSPYSMSDILMAHGLDTLDETTDKIGKSLVSDERALRKTYDGVYSDMIINGYKNNTDNPLSVLDEAMSDSNISQYVTPNVIMDRVGRYLSTTGDVNSIIGLSKSTYASNMNSRGVSISDLLFSNGKLPDGITKDQYSDTYADTVEALNILDTGWNTQHTYAIQPDRQIDYGSDDWTPTDISHMYYTGEEEDEDHVIHVSNKTAKNLNNVSSDMFTLMDAYTSNNNIELHVPDPVPAEGYDPQIPLTAAQHVTAATIAAYGSGETLTDQYRYDYSDIDKLITEELTGASE